jgi:hypothetical protein
MTMANSPIAEWLARANKKGTARVELWTWRGDHPERQVALWKTLAEDGAALADEIQADAENHGRSQNGQRVTYGLLAYDAAGDKVGEHFVKVAGGNAKEPDAGPSPTDLAGVVAHLVRGNNDLAGVVIRAFQGRDDTLIRQLELLSSRLDAAEKRNAESLVEQQRMIMLSAEQKRLDAQLAHDQMREAWVRDAATVFLPMVVNRLLGGGPGQGAPAGDLIVNAITQTLTPAEIDALVDAVQNARIHDAKKVGFVEVLRGVMRRQQQALEDAAAAQAGAP